MTPSNWHLFIMQKMSSLPSLVGAVRLRFWQRRDSSTERLVEELRLNSGLVTNYFGILTYTSGKVSFLLVFFS